MIDQGGLVIGHGSGSFGHYMASKYGTRKGVDGPDQWAGFAKGEWSFKAVL